MIRPVWTSVRRTLHRRLFTKPARRRVTYGEGETLEGRTMLSAYVVDTLADDASAGAGAKDGQVSLREALNAINSGRSFGDAAAPSAGVDTIRFKPALAGGTIDLDGESLKILSDVNIIANGIRIDANGQSRGLLISGADVNLTNLTVLDGNGGGKLGGAIRVANSELILNRVNVLGSSAINGGGLGVTNSVVRTFNTSFEENEARQYGGGVFLRDSTLITRPGTVFSGNAAGQATGTGPNGGGAIAQQGGTTNIFDTTFLHNTARGRNSAGGAVLVAAGGQSRIAQSDFVENGTDAFGSFRGLGGAVAVLQQGRGFIVDTSFTGNEAYSGGAVFSAGNTDLLRTTIIDNAAVSFGGGVFTDDLGPGVSVLRVTDSVIQNNGANDGAGLALLETRATIDGSLIGGDTVNEANKARFDGGGIFIGGDRDEASRTIVRATRIASNEARFSGGGIDFRSAGGVLRVDGGSIIELNTAQSGGGVAIRPLSDRSGDETTYRFQGAKVRDNVAGNQGGGIAVSTDDTAGLVKGALVNSEFTGNAAGTTAGGLNFGGGAFIDGRSLVIGSLFSGNTATGVGGGLFIADTAFQRLNGSAVRNNIASVNNGTSSRVGGGVYVEEGGLLDLDQSEIAGNTRVRGNGPIDNLFRE